MSSTSGVESPPRVTTRGTFGPALRGALRGLAGRLRGLFWTVASIGCVLVGWQLAYAFGGLGEEILPAPYTVAQEFWAVRELLFEQALVSLRPIVGGFLASVVIGTLIGLAIAFSKAIERLVYPSLVIAQAVPKVAVVPVLIIWFGLAPSMHAILAFSVAVFPVIINATLGFSDIDRDYIQLGRAMNASRWRLFWKIRLPIAIPKLFAGYKVAITLAATGAIVGEMVAGNNGLGYLGQAASGNLQAPLTFAAIVAMAILGVAVFYLVVLAEAIVLRVTHLDKAGSTESSIKL